MPQITLLLVMSTYFFPRGMRLTTLDERNEFYIKEFNVEALQRWLKFRSGKTKFAVIIGSHTDIYPPIYRKDKNTTIIIDEYADLQDLQNQILRFLPEAVYYDRNVYNQEGEVVGQELAFDVDPENLTCPIHGTLADKLARHQGLSFCSLELEMAKQQTGGLYEFLKKHFSKLRIVYSGRGFHIHVLDAEAFSLSKDSRATLAARVKAKGFEIDAWVTEGEMRFIRLPYSLNGLVSRIVLPLEQEELAKFNPVTDLRCIPNFLKHHSKH
jgi:DNA primase catalytic subunit